MNNDRIKEVFSIKSIKQIFKYISSVISYSIFIILLIIGLCLVFYVVDIKIQQARGGDAKPLFGAYTIISGSMEPDILVYDVVVAKRIDSEKLKKGDVITFYSNDTRFYGATITHRIIEVIDSKKGIFRTQGDANNVSDEALTIGDNIVGKVFLKIPQLGRIQFLVASKGGWLIVILIPCLSIIAYDIVKLIKLSRKKLT